MKKMMDQKTLRAGLSIVRDMLAGGQITDKQFSMTVWNGDGVHCIGGWVEIVTNRGIDDSPIPNMYCVCLCDIREVGGPGLVELLYPDDMSLWEKITREHAVKSIDNYLNYGWPHWEYPNWPSMVK